MTLLTSRFRSTHSRGSRRSDIQFLESRRMLCYSDGGVVQHIGSRSHPAANAAQMLEDAIAPVIEDQVIVPGGVDPTKPSPMETTPVAARGGSGDALPGNLLFSSRPGAPVTLFIDFDGEGEVGFAEGFLGFGGYDVPTTPAYDIDGNPGSFNSTEQQNIERMWSIVAEKYSPLNVNVTTVDPGSLDSEEECKVVVGGNGSWYGKGGGVAVEDGFFDDGIFESADNRAFVWRDAATPDSMGEAIAHEAGHMFGLKHNSSADFYGNITTEYRPGWIMGEGYNPGGTPGRWDINQTSSYVDDGDIKNAGHQSDIATMINEAGLQLRPDDHTGSIFGVPTPLYTTATGRGGNGVHETEGDADYFSFTTSGGFMTITVNPAPFQAMDNLTLEVVGITTVNTANQGETWTSSGTMAAGTYVIAVRSRGNIGDLGSYSVGVTLNETFNNSIKTATPVGRFGELPGLFGLVNPIYAGRGVIADNVGNSDIEDYYRIQTDTITTRQTVWLYGMSADADVRIIRDYNRNQQVDGNEVLAFSNVSGNANEGFTIDLAPNATYYIHVYRYQTAQTNYSLELRADGAGEGPVNAGLPARGPNVFAGEGAYYDQVDEFELRDVYRVRPDYPGYLDVSLTGLGADLDLAVALDLNNNGVIESGEMLYKSSLSGSNSESLIDIEVNPAWNAFGGYYVIVYYYTGFVSNYRLGLHLDTSLASGPNDLTHPWVRDLGSLATNNYRSFEEYVGNADNFDLYRFTAPPGLLSIRSSGAGHYRDLIRDGNNNGVIDNFEIVANSLGNIDYTVPGAPGTLQTMYLRVQRSGGEFPSDGNYVQRIASQYTLPTSDNSFVTARELSLNTSLQAFSGFLQSAPDAPEFNDFEDYYTFTLAEAQRSLFSLSGIAFRGGSGETVGLPLAGLQVIYDANGNGELDADERVAGQGVYSSRRSTSIEAQLAAGTYFVRVFVERPERADAAGAARTNYTLNYQNLETVEDPAPYVIDSSLHFETAPQGLLIEFSEDVSGTLNTDDIAVTDSLGNGIPIGNLAYDATTNTAYVTFDSLAYPSGVLPDGLYTVAIDPVTNVRDASGIAMEAAFSGEFHVLTGDANRDRVVNFDDLLTVAQNYGSTGLTWSAGDFDYNGAVDFDDLLTIAQRYGSSLMADWNLARQIAAGGGTREGLVSRAMIDALPASETRTSRSARRISDEIL